MESTELVFKTHYCEHSGGLYSLQLEFECRHVDLQTFYYPHTGGNNINISVYGLTPEDMLEIANRIKKTAFEIKPELKDGK